MSKQLLKNLTTILGDDGSESHAEMDIRTAQGGFDADFGI